MPQLTRDDLFSLERYAEKRAAYRAQVMEHKKKRLVPIGDHATLYFEDRLTIQYQIQEMLRVERIFEAAGIQEELDAYNALIPDGSNWKATFMIEYGDEDERRQALIRLKGIEDKLWIQVSGHDKVFAIADEDLERENDEKTSAVHFMRFELTPEMVAKATSGSGVTMGSDHPEYDYQTELDEAVRQSLAQDLG